MKAVLQRVTSAELSVGGSLVSSIGEGLVVYLGVAVGDTLEQAQAIASKITNIRIFEDENGRMNVSTLTGGYEVLLVSQFTLLADASHGNRPSYSNACNGQLAEPIYLHCANCLRDNGLSVKLGVFGADMTIKQVNQGPVTIILDK